MADEPRLSVEQEVVAQAFRRAAEIQAVVPDRELAARLALQVAEAFAQGMREGEAARAAAALEPEPEPDGLVIATNIHPIGPGDERARELRWID